MFPINNLFYVCLSLCRQHESWAPAEIFADGAKPPTLKNVDNFSARRRENLSFFRCSQDWCKRTFLRFFFLLRRFRLNLRVFIASDNFRVFRRRAVYDVIFFKFQEASAPSLQAPMARVPHKLQYSQFIVHQVNTCFNGRLLHNK